MCYLDRTFLMLLTAVPYSLTPPSVLSSIKETVLTRMGRPPKQV